MPLRRTLRWSLIRLEEASILSPLFLCPQLLRSVASLRAIHLALCRAERRDRIHFPNGTVRLDSVNGCCSERVRHVTRSTTDMRLVSPHRECGTDSTEFAEEKRIAGRWFSLWGLTNFKRRDRIPTQRAFRGFFLSSFFGPSY